MISGYGLSTREVDLMIEDQAAAEWERINADDPDENKFIEAGYELGNAYDYIGEAMDSIFSAAKEADGTVAYDKIISILDDLNDLQGEVMILKNKLKKGRCD